MDQVMQEIFHEVDLQPRGLVGPLAKGTNPGMEWIGRLVRRLGIAIKDDGVWSPLKFRHGMVEVAACAVAAIRWVDRHYPRSDTQE